MLYKRPLTTFIYSISLTVLFAALSLVHAANMPEKVNASAEHFHDPDHVTVLYLMGEQAPMEWHQRFRNGFKQGLRNHIDDFKVNEITYSMHKAHSLQSLDDQMAYLEKKFQHRHIDYIVSDVSSTQEALDRHPEFLPFAKRIFFSQNSIGTEDIVEITEQRSLVRVGQRYQRSIATMLQVAQPKKVHVFGDKNSKYGAERARLFQQAVAQTNSKVPFVYYLDEDLDEMKQIIEGLPKDEAIYYLIVQRDSNGNVYSPVDALRVLGQNNHPPIFSHWEPMVGEDAVGGYMVSATAMGKAAANFIAHHQQDTLPTINPDSLFEHVYDDRELFEYNIPNYRLSKDARILFPQKGYLEHHLTEVILIGTASIISLLFVAGFLFQKVKHREKALIEATASAEHANQAKSNFLATMSHELRTPLNAILGITSVLKDSPQQDKTTTEQLNLVHSSAIRFTNMLNEILDLNKIQSDRLQLAPETFNIGELCRDSVALFSQRAQAKNLTLNKDQIACDQWVFADPLRLRQIITNLLGNAIKFTEEGGVTLICRTQTIGRHVSLTLKIKDTGVGISKKDLPTIFDRFTQVDSSNSRRFQGTGLGLSIVHELTELFGGQIRVESQLGKGTCFTLTFSLPVAEAPSLKLEPNVPEASSPASSNDLTILVVDDVQTNCMVAEIILKKLGHNSLSVNSGKDAISLLSTRDDIDLVLMDLQMPELDGYETTRLLRESGFNKPIIALSANAQKDVDQACYQAGMSGYVAKPISVKDLSAVLADIDLDKPIQATA